MQILTWMLRRAIMKAVNFDSFAYILIERRLIMDVTESIRKASLEILLLAQLKYRDMYAYEMALEIIRKSNGDIPIVMTVVYPILQRLESKGYITSKESVTKENRKTVIFHLEESGAVYLNEVRAAFHYMDKLIDNFLSDGGIV